MVNWFIIVLVIIGVLIVIKLLHLRHLRHRLFGILIVVVLLFLIGSIYFVAKENNIDMTTAGGFTKGMQVYSGWLLNSFQNIGSITGYTIGLDWSSKNKTVSDSNIVVNKTHEISSKIVESGGNIVEKGERIVDKVKANTPKKITNY